MALLTTTSPLDPDPVLGTAKPAVGVRFHDVAHDTYLHRVTDAASEGLAHYSSEYSSTCLTNADGTVLRIERASGGFDFFELSGGVWTKTKQKNFVEFGPSDWWWHPTDPDVGYQLGYAPSAPYSGLPTGLWKYSYAANTQTILHDFNDDGFVAIADGGENHLSNDGSLIAFYAQPSGEPEMTDIVLYNIDTDTIVAQLKVLDTSSPISWGGVAPNQFKDITVSGDGTRVGFTGTSNNTYFIFAVSGSTFSHVITHASQIGHKDSNTGPDGNDYIFTDFGGINNIKRIAFDDGSTQNTRTGVFPGYGALPPPSQAYHITCATLPLDGYVYAGFYNGSQVGVPGTSSWGYLSSEVARWQYDQSGDVERVVHIRGPVGTDYYEQEKTNVSRDGEWLFFTSTWQGAGLPDVYAVELPALAPAEPATPFGPWWIPVGG